MSDHVCLSRCVDLDAARAQVSTLAPSVLYAAAAAAAAAAVCFQGLLLTAANDAACG